MSLFYEPFLQHDSQKLNLSFWTWSCLEKWLKELNPFVFFNNDSKDWTLCQWLIELTLFYEPLLNKSWFFLLTQRIELSLNVTQSVDFFLSVTQRIEPSSFWSMTQRIEPFFLNVTQRIGPIFWMWLFFKKKNSKNWTLFQKMTQRIELFFLYDSKNWTFYCLTQRIEPFSYLTQCIRLFLICLKELSLFSKYDSKNWIVFLCNSKNWTFFEFDSNFRTFFIEYDAINRTSFWVRLKDFLFSIWRKEWNFWKRLKELIFFLKMTQRIEPFFLHDSQNWTFFWEIRFKELNLFLSMTQRIELFFEYDSKNRTPFFDNTQWIEPIFLNLDQWIEPSLTWLEELNFFQKRMTQRIEISWAWHKELNPFSLIWRKEFAK